MNIELEREAFEQHITDTGLVEFAGYRFEVDECGEYTHEPTNVAWGSWQIGMNRAKAYEAKKLEGCVVVPDTHMLIEKKDIENWYLDESEYMWFEADGIDGYLEDIDIGEVIEVQRKEYVVTNNNPVFAAKPWDDNGNCADTWEFFESKDEAEKAAAHCKAMLEAARGGK
ncbi:hypothetical protein [Acinetobacter haemolyticus]|uniref:hypothetical protein n=1 Tax=Acinetobacter haemolyticus TaxID=29430 RepID=UPI00137323B4|nr:hypothetical protein [Acinetobacter haemolyticus]NAR60047.1 hypothetical protein [Acinetobacter haemolyticus]NAR94189.1 hypothetical protein [Acinetobacter haemolyticus]